VLCIQKFGAAGRAGRASGPKAILAPPWDIPAKASVRYSSARQTQ
jgi:hypothetical protein